MSHPAIPQLMDELAALRAENQRLREALTTIAEKAGSHTVSASQIAAGQDDHGIAGIFFVARAALEKPQ